jgi:starvation-inducible DNA-binding protein
MKVNIGISQKKIKATCTILGKVLADAHVLYIKARKFHWNVSGKSFMELHKLFETHYEQIAQNIDEIAERISKLGEVVPGTMEEFLKNTALKEHSNKVPTQAEMIAELLTDHETIIKSLRHYTKDSDEKFDDVGTSDFLTDLLKGHETLAWTLRRYLQ